MRSIHSRHYIYTHWLRIDNQNNEKKQWENLKDYWNKYDCSMTVYYYDYNPLTEKVIKLDCNQSYQNLDLDVNSMSSGSLKRIKSKPTNISLYNRGISSFFESKLGKEVTKTLRQEKKEINISEENLIIVDALKEFKYTKNIKEFCEIMKEENWKIVKIPSSSSYHYQLYFGKGKQVYNRYEYAFGKFNYKSVFKDRLERFINNVINQRKLNVNNFIGKKINMLRLNEVITDEVNNDNITCIGLVLGINNNCFDIYDSKSPLGQEYYSLELKEFEKKVNEGVFKPNFNILSAYEKLELRKYNYQKSQKFIDICDELNIINPDISNIKLYSIKIYKDEIAFFYKRYSNELESYILCKNYKVHSNKLVSDFNILDLENKTDVQNFWYKLNELIDFDKVKEMLNEQEEKEIKEKEIIEDMEIEYE